ncbi:MAG: AbrB/MazE/SpoVT family DNA-binding domain-containing protein [Candidatus Promineofilum sp.]|nr:AbrB/MazE/SpoVT family DNA-binding domain-containing protein [Promineifilum sp.]
MLYEDRPYAIQVRQRGQVTIPRRLRESLAIEEGDTLTVFQAGDALLLAPRPLQTPQLIDRMADMLDESGVTLADLLADLPRIREEIYRERYQTNQEE